MLRKILRQFFAINNCLEVDTPVAVDLPGVEVHLDFFATEYLDIAGVSKTMFLRTSPEVQMKRLLAQGLDRIYQIGPCFRNRGEFSDWHHPEFTMVEWYLCNFTLSQMMKFTEDLLLESSQLFYAQNRSSQKFEGPIRKFKIADIFKESTNVDLQMNDPEFARQLRLAGNRSVSDSDDSETAFFKAMLDQVEPLLKNYPLCMLYDYPPQTSALAVVEDGVAKRFEVYARGVELCNGFAELTGKAENQKRHAEVNQRRVEAGKDPLFVDHDFFDAMGKVPQIISGNALGFDRWLAILLGKTLNEIIPLR